MLDQRGFQLKIVAEDGLRVCVLREDFQAAGVPEQAHIFEAPGGVGIGTFWLIQHADEMYLMGKLNIYTMKREMTMQTELRNKKIERMTKGLFDNKENRWVKKCWKSGMIDWWWMNLMR